MKEIQKIYNDKVKLAAVIVKGITAVVGSSLILSTEHPYLALTALSIGAGINEFLLFVERKRKRNIY